MPPISRREALAAGLTAAAGLASAAPVPKGKDTSWVGKTVLPKKPSLVAATPALNAEGQPGESYRFLEGSSWEVKSEKGDKIEVIEGHASWVEKAAVVRLADAIEFYSNAIKENEKDAYSYNFRGWAKYLLGKPEEAIKDFDEFLKIVPAGDAAQAPDRPVGLSNRGLVLAETGRFDAALKDLDEAVTLNHPIAHLNRGWAYELKGEYKKAEADYASLLALQPADVMAANNMAWLKATCPDAAVRDGKEAVRVAKLACEKTANRDGMFLDTLAAAHAEAGDFAAAVKAQELALEDKGYAKKYGDEAQKRLALYKDKKPFRTAPLKAK